MTASPDRLPAGTASETRRGTSTHQHDTTRGDLMRTTYTADEVHALLHAAYLRGRYDADLNDLHGTWTEYAEPRATREQRVQARLAEMDRVAQITAARQGRPYRIHPGGPVDWNTGRPVRHLEVAA